MKYGKSAVNIMFIAMPFLLFSGCSKTEGQEQKVSAANEEFRVINWGPQFTTIGIVPNKQPNGSFGLWIEASGVRGLGEVQVQLAGKPANVTSSEERLITAGIAPEQLMDVGDKDVVVKQLSTGKIFSIGIFKVLQK